MEEQTKGISKPILTIIAVIVVAVGAVIAYASGLFKSTAPASNSQTQDNTQNTTPVATETKYKDGTYTADGSYHSPGGQEQFGLSITLKNNIITAATFTPEPVSPRGQTMQAQFNQGFQEQVVGKDINTISLTVVNGASLTTKGFMTALQSIEMQASAA